MLLPSDEKLTYTPTHIHRHTYTHRGCFSRFLCIIIFPIFRINILNFVSILHTSHEIYIFLIFVFHKLLSESCFMLCLIWFLYKISRFHTSCLSFTVVVFSIIFLEYTEITFEWWWFVCCFYAQFVKYLYISFLVYVM